MERYYKNIEDGYLTTIGTGASGSSIRLYSDDGVVMLSSSNGTTFSGNLSGQIRNPTIEIHYIP